MFLNVQDDRGHNYEEFHLLIIKIRHHQPYFRPFQNFPPVNPPREDPPGGPPPGGSSLGGLTGGKLSISNYNELVK